MGANPNRISSPFAYLIAADSRSHPPPSAQVSRHDTYQALSSADDGRRSCCAISVPPATRHGAASSVTEPRRASRAPCSRSARGPSRTAALAGPALAEFLVCGGQVGQVFIIAVALDLPSHVGEQILGPVAAEASAHPAVGGPHATRDANGRGGCLAGHGNPSLYLHGRSYGNSCVATRFQVVCSYTVLAERNPDDRPGDPDPVPPLRPAPDRAGQYQRRLWPHLPGAYPHRGRGGRPQRVPRLAGREGPRGHRDARRGPRSEERR